MAGEGGALLTVHEETDLGNIEGEGLRESSRRWKRTVRGFGLEAGGWLAAKVPVRLTTAS